MAKSSPWHSDTGNVYHNDTDCTNGKSITKEHRKRGTGGHPLCHECARL
jgi:hypothetical protein